MDNEELALSAIRLWIGRGFSIVDRLTVDSDSCAGLKIMFGGRKNCRKLTLLFVLLVGFPGVLGWYVFLCVFSR